MDFLFSKDSFFYKESIGGNNWDYFGKDFQVNNLCFFFPLISKIFISFKGTRDGFELIVFLILNPIFGLSWIFPKVLKGLVLYWSKF
jgi:hypothetical protein